MSDTRVETTDAALKEEVEKLDAMLAPDLK